MSKIFVSYRREDSSGYAGRLVQDLNSCFGDENIFQDIEAIESGEDFVAALDHAVGSCSVLLALIGPGWLTETDLNNKPRLENPEDFVRLEIAAALQRNIRVIPLLVQGAVMPSADDLPDELKPLARRQAHEISDTRWDYDVEQLIDSLKKIPDIGPLETVSRKTTTTGTATEPQPKPGAPLAI